MFWPLPLNFNSQLPVISPLLGEKLKFYWELVCKQPCHSSYNVYAVLHSLTSIIYPSAPRGVTGIYGSQQALVLAQKRSIAGTAAPAAALLLPPSIALAFK